MRIQQKHHKFECELAGPTCAWCRNELRRGGADELESDARGGEINMWWLEPSWTNTYCHCGKKIWPEGDPDWGECYDCFSDHIRDRKRTLKKHPKCAICGRYEAVTGVNGFGVCSEVCAHTAAAKEESHDRL